jgi:hypothetical protein
VTDSLTTTTTGRKLIETANRCRRISIMTQNIPLARFFDMCPLFKFVLTFKTKFYNDCMCQYRGPASLPSQPLKASHFSTVPAHHARGFGLSPMQSTLACDAPFLSRVFSAASIAEQLILWRSRAIEICNRPFSLNTCTSSAQIFSHAQIKRSQNSSRRHRCTENNRQK